MKSNQERILEKYQTFEAVKDCFALARIQEASNCLLGSRIPIPEWAVKEIKLLYEERDQILRKYPDADFTLTEKR